MRKFLVLFFVVLICFSACACDTKTADTDSDKIPVVINVAKDDSVNGYRTAPKVQENMQNNTTQTDSTVGEGSNEFQYCGNRNSKVLHKISCGSVSNMKDANKVYYKTREEAIAGGYKPCGSCKP